MTTTATRRRSTRLLTLGARAFKRYMRRSKESSNAWRAFRCSHKPEAMARNKARWEQATRLHREALVLYREIQRAYGREFIDPYLDREG